MKATSILAASACLIAQQTLSAATVTFNQEFGPAGRAFDPPIVLADPNLAGKRIHQFRVTTDADILRVGDVHFINLAGLYNHAFGQDTAPPLPVFVALFPQLAADTWITTPGATAIAGNSANPFGTDNNSWFDTSNDGPVTEFLFARLTVNTMPVGYFRGVVSVAGTEGPEAFPFNFQINVPEPGALALGIVAVGASVATLRRRRPLA
jgi:hypothetical protein